jgi:hypothetical protein
MATKTPPSPDYDIYELTEEYEFAENKNSNKYGWFIALAIGFFSAIAAGAFFLFSSDTEQPNLPNQLLGPTDIVQSYGWDTLDGVCLNNRIIGAAPLRGVCGPSWEKIFTQISEIITGPGEIVTVTEVQTVRVFEPGNRVYLAERDPRRQEGISGDVFINQLSGDLYTKSEADWDLTSNVSTEVTVTEIQTRTEFIVVDGGSGDSIGGSASLGPCDDRVNISARPTFNPLAGTWSINTVTFSDISINCNGKTLAVQLLDNTLERANQTLVISGTTAVFNFSAEPVLTRDVTRIVFAIYD